MKTNEFKNFNNRFKIINALMFSSFSLFTIKLLIMLQYRFTINY